MTAGVYVGCIHASARKKRSVMILFLWVVACLLGWLVGHDGRWAVVGLNADDFVHFLFSGFSGCFCLFVVVLGSLARRVAKEGRGGREDEQSD
mmetsp:Transcript_37143/g.119130  ORF Transcript_37143/g.119130 Transcript_37143/m.119130 type:complete len:93 (-) Transcript_37143:1691-1969(-)